MRRALLLLAVLSTALPGCAMTPDLDSERAAVDAVLDDFHAAASEADGDRYFAHFAPDGVFIGTDATERWNVEAFRAFAEPYFSKGKGWTYHSVERHVGFHPGGETAWFDERLTNEAYGETRGSGALRRIDDAWRIEQYVLSFPIPNDIAKGVVAQIRAMDAGSTKKEGIMTLPSVGFVKVPVADVETSAVFYRDTLGLKEDFVVAEYGWAQFSTGSVPICLYVPGKGGGDATPGGDTGIQLRVDDAKAAFEKLSAAGAVQGELNTGDDGTASFLAKDPDGNLIQIAQVAQ